MVRIFKNFSQILENVCVCVCAEHMPIETKLRLNHVHIHVKEVKKNKIHAEAGGKYINLFS